MDRLFLFNVLTPAATPQATPLTTALPLEDTQLVEVRIVIPDGHVGLTGIRLLQANQQVVPWANNSFLIGNDRIITVPFDAEMTATGLVASTYNTDVFDHNHYLEVVIRDLPRVNPITSGPQSGPLLLPTVDTATLDPLSPASLIASVPADDMSAPELLDVGS